MAPSQKDVNLIFERLRSGVVPERGLDEFAVGIERQRAELGRMLDMAEASEGVFKFLRGGYGCGKTFMARLAVLDAQARGFATSFVVVSDNDLHFHRFDDVYRKVVQELGTSSCPRGALGDIIDRWVARVEDALVGAGADESAPDFDEQVSKRLGEELTSLTNGKAPEDMARVLREVFALKQAGKVAEAGALLSWLSGSENVAAAQKKAAGIKGDISSRDAFDYLHGILEIVKAAGYKGLVIVIDEAETILRMRQDVRGKSLNGIRQICDAADRYHGLLWIFTGTPEFFDTTRGVKG
ncbi:MAG TPA: BREX system ATP-binding protein BrxD, partial [Myxococcaceae bacterium]|nr:BREX system ATP-binding protein BrxD [Myxococcaceae bacterium]